MEKIIYPLFGGALIGVATSLVLFGLGRITGISGVFASAFLNEPKKSENWKHFFIAGLLLGGFVMLSFNPELFSYEFEESIILTVIAGLFVGFGTRYGSGCTSGHGVCGFPRRSVRSVLATIVFMLFGMITVLIKGLL